MKKIANTIIKAFKNGNKLLICGCGGSAAQAQHLATELICKFEHDRRPLPAIALTTDSSIITAWSNDKDFRGVFSRQVTALGGIGDVLLIISTSGNSAVNNIAEIAAKKMGMIVLKLPTGKNTAKTQEKHLKMIHDIARNVEKAFI